MTSDQDRINQAVLDAVTDFHQSVSWEDLWNRLHRHLLRYGITELMYGSEAYPNLEQTLDVFLSSYDSVYMNNKMSSGLFYCDEYVRLAKVETAPVLWSEASRLESLSPEARRSLDLDWDYRVVTGVTLPIRFHHGMGRSGLGCHAAGVSWADFDRIWAEHGATICAIVHAFDVRLREAHAGEMFALAPRERECLLWLAAGLRPKQIAHRLGTHMKTVEKQVESARHKLKAASVAQAVATALIFGLIAP